MTTFTNESKNVIVNTYLLLESGDFLLQEDGDKLVLTGSGGFDNSVKNNNTFTNQSKN